MKSKTNRKVKRSKKTRRTRRNLKKVRGGGVWEWWAKRNNPDYKGEKQNIINKCKSCKETCEKTQDVELKQLEQRYKPPVTGAVTAGPNQESQGLTTLQEVMTAKKPEMTEFERKVKDYKADNEQGGYPRHPMSERDWDSMRGTPKYNDKNTTDNGWYVDEDKTDPSKVKLYVKNKYVEDMSFEVSSKGIYDFYQWYIERLPNPRLQYQSSKDVSVYYELVKKGDELKWQNKKDTGVLFDFDPHLPLLLKTAWHDDKPDLLRPTDEPAK